MLKLCLALPIFYPTFGGGSLRFLRYQPGLRKHDIQARVLAGTARTKDAFHTDAELGWDEYAVGTMMPIDRVEGLPVHRVRLTDETGFARTATYFRALIALCRKPETRPDVIQLHSFERLESLYWLRRLRTLGIPIVYAIQIARPAGDGSRFRGFLKKQILRRFYNLFDGVVTSSERIRDYLREIGVRTPIAVIPNGVDLEQYRPGDAAMRERARRTLGIEGSGPVILTVGAVSPRKGTDLLVEAFADIARKHPEAELVIVGPRHDRHNQKLDSFESRLDQLVRSAPAPERIHRTGVRDDLPELYAAADLVVLPSSREGGTPNVVLEAMACARPVMITPFEGQSAAIGRAGIEFEEVPRAVRPLAEAMARLLEDPSRREELVRNGREWVTRHLDLQISIDRFADFYRRAADGTLSVQALEDTHSEMPDAYLSSEARSERPQPT